MHKKFYDSKGVNSHKWKLIQPTSYSVTAKNIRWVLSVEQYKTCGNVDKVNMNLVCWEMNFYIDKSKLVRKRVFLQLGFHVFS